MLSNCCRYLDAETLGLDILASTAEAHPETPLHAEVLSTLSSVCLQRGIPAALEAAERYAKQGLDFVVKAHGVKSLEAAAMFTTLASAQQRLARCVSAHFGYIRFNSYAAGLLSLCSVGWRMRSHHASRR